MVVTSVDGPALRDKSVESASVHCARCNSRSTAGLLGEIALQISGPKYGFETPAAHCAFPSSATTMIFAMNEWHP